MIQKVPKQSYKRSQMLCQVMATIYKILLFYMNTFSNCHELRRFHVTDNVFESVKLHCHFINIPGSTLQFLSILHSFLVWTQSTYIIIIWQSDVAVLHSILFSEDECMQQYHRLIIMLSFLSPCLHMAPYHDQGYSQFKTTIM